MSDLKQAYDRCREITKQASSTFYWGSMLFPPEIQRAVWAIYAYCRQTDDFVDTHELSLTSDPHIRTLLLHGLELRADLVRLCFTYKSAGYIHNRLAEETTMCVRDDYFVFTALCDVVRNYPKLHQSSLLKLIDGVKMDLDKQVYNTYKDLVVYCDKVAGIVGEMICALCGIDDEHILVDARFLGEAMQITNILRDVGEDLQKGRVYLPQRDFEKGQVNLLSLYEKAKSGDWSTEDTEIAQFISLMKKYISMNHKQYECASLGISLLPLSIQTPVRTAAAMYEAILDAIERNNYNVFTKRAYVRKRDKVKIAAQTIFLFSSFQRQ